MKKFTTRFISSNFKHEQSSDYTAVAKFKRLLSKQPVERQMHPKQAPQTYSTC
jgi:hypothetical protein